MKWIKSLFRRNKATHQEAADAARQLLELNRRAVNDDLQNIQERLMNHPITGSSAFALRADAAEKEATEFRKDKARLDWIEKEGVEGGLLKQVEPVLAVGGRGWAVWLDDRGGGVYHRGLKPTLREAIDAAMEGEK